MIIYPLFLCTYLNNQAHVLRFDHLNFIWIFVTLYFINSSHIVHISCYVIVANRILVDLVTKTLLYTKQRYFADDYIFQEALPGVRCQNDVCVISTLRPKQNDRYIFRRMHVQNHFLVWQSLYFNSNFTEICFEESDPQLQWVTCKLFNWHCINIFVRTFFEILY